MMQQEPDVEVGKEQLRERTRKPTPNSMHQLGSGKVQQLSDRKSAGKQA
jgi:hypothetical protein